MRNHFRTDITLLLFLIMYTGCNRQYRGNQKYLTVQLLLLKLHLECFHASCKMRTRKGDVFGKIRQKRKEQILTKEKKENIK